MSVKDRERAKEHHRVRRQKILECFDNKCLLCGYQDIYGGRMTLHEKNWIKHPIRLRYYEEHIKDFVYLCFKCHQAVHWLYNMFGLDWFEIITLINSLKKI